MIWCANEQGISVNTVMDLPRHARVPEAQTWMRKAAILDRFYIPTRYPNGLPDLIPEKSFFRQDAEQGITLALYFLEACRQWREEYIERKFNQ